MLKANLAKLKQRGPSPVLPQHPGEKEQEQEQEQEGMDSMFLAAGEEFSGPDSGSDSGPNSDDSELGTDGELARTPFPVAGSYLKPKKKLLK